MTDTRIRGPQGLRLPPPPHHEPVGGACSGLPPPPAAAGARRRGRGGLLIVAAVVAAVVSAVVTLALTGDGDAAGPTPRAEPPALQVDGEASPVSAVAEAVLPSVAQVEVAGAQGQGAGSAVIFREDGYLLTNNHVVAGAQAVRVTLPDGSPQDADVVGTDPPSDLAVLQIDVEDLPVPRFAEDPPRVGDTAVAVGSPFGLESTVTAGIVSALNREVPAPDVQLIDMIQTDAAINPGNSGGALANGDGEIIGINTAIVSGSGASAGVGFAIPITSALTAGEQIVEQGFVEHPVLGIRGQDLDPAAADLYGLPVDAGAVVIDVIDGTGAADAGLERGDIVVGIDGEEVNSISQLTAEVRRHSPGDEVTLDVVRGGETSEIDVELTAVPGE
jgi:S1-C subfamily serine protease